MFRHHPILSTHRDPVKRDCMDGWMGTTFPESFFVVAGDSMVSPSLPVLPACLPDFDLCVIISHHYEFSTRQSI